MTSDHPIPFRTLFAPDGARPLTCNQNDCHVVLLCPHHRSYTMYEGNKPSATTARTFIMSGLAPVPRKDPSNPLTLPLLRMPTPSLRAALLSPLKAPPTLVDDALAPEYTCIEGYTFSRARIVLYYALCVLSGGLVWLTTSWWSQYFTNIARSSASSLATADVVVLRDANGAMVEVAVHQASIWRFFDYRQQRYFYIDGAYERGTIDGLCNGGEAPIMC